MRRLQSLFALLAGVAFVTCGPQSGSAPAGTAAAIVAPGPSLLERIPDAPLTRAYRGTRRVTFRYDIEGQAQTTAYEEHVASDGAGRFQVRTTELHQPPLSGEALEFFLVRQQAYESFFYLHRDFRIRSLPLFLQNYTLRQGPVANSVAGRESVAFAIRPRVAGGSSYRAEVDVETGLILRWKEWNPLGVLIADVEFTEFTLDPDLTGVELNSPSLQTVALDLEGDVVGQIGFQVSRPRFVPQGYRAMKSEKVTVASSSWARLTYGNGVEQLFYLFQAPAAGTMPNTSVNGSSNGADSITLSQVGPWTAASGQVGGRRYIVMGKVSDTTLLDMIQSAL
ncbi:MAG: sigma-E factor regulatory protein RseB domain-containing protein [Planctomycetota bacterium]